MPPILGFFQSVCFLPLHLLVVVCLDILVLLLAIVVLGIADCQKYIQPQKAPFAEKEENLEFRVVNFPNYDNASSSLVKMYLSGEFGENAKDVSPYIASTFYAADRYATFKRYYEDYYKDGGIILADRYTTANMVHQAGKIENKEERKKFQKVVDNRILI